MNKYPHIDNLYRIDPHEFANWPEVIVTEKLHGCNFRVHIPSNALTIDDIQFGSRNHEVKLGSNFYGDRPVRYFIEHHRIALHRMLQHHRAVNAKLREEYGEDARGHSLTVFGEMIGAGIQRGVKYLTEDTVEFRAFDAGISIDGDEGLGGLDFMPYDVFIQFVTNCGIIHVPALYRGLPDSQLFDQLRNQTSLEAKINGAGEEQRAEGIVIKTTATRNLESKFITKFKSDGFEEMSKTPAVRPVRFPSICNEVAMTYVTRGRVLNAIEKWDSNYDGQNPHCVKVEDMSAMKHIPNVVYLDILNDEYDAEKGHPFRTLCRSALRSAITRQTGIVLRGILNERAGSEAVIVAGREI